MSKQQFILSNSIFWGLATGLLAGLAVKGIIPIFAAAIGISMSFVFWRVDRKRVEEDEE